MADTSSAEYAECIRYIFANADFSGSAARYKNLAENWARFDMLMQALDRPLDRLKCVHIAGTNGKGTTSALCEAALRASGSRVGLFTSPHLHSWRERIRIDGELVSKDLVVTAMRRVRPAVEALGHATPFEKLSALAFVCFTAAGVDWAVLETGLGGRWDCTNHCAPRVCGITRVGLDHMNVLGKDVATIAGEKAGILKCGVPAFAVPQDASALPVIASAAEEVGAPLVILSEADAAAEVANGDLPFWLSPEHQQLNAALAMAMVRSLASRGELRDDCAAWLAARDAASWPARFETLRPAVLKGASTLVIDVAHNEPAIAALLPSVVRAWPSAPLVVIFGANNDKDARGIAQLLVSQSSLVAGVAVASSHPKALTPAQIRDACVVAMDGGGAQVHGTAEGGLAKAQTAPWNQANSMLDALRLAATALAERSGGVGGVVLCCGSVFVAADMRAALAAEEPTLFAATDWVFAGNSEPALM
mmetsp:Transcript_87526/g.245843  ORF Transcript_87526/g.245843 Transcript_87526/m.245843 type:complete len:478 (-) Transcript_87526:37-1470(-)